MGSASFRHEARALIFENELFDHFVGLAVKPLYFTRLYQETEIGRALLDVAQPPVTAAEKVDLASPLFERNAAEVIFETDQPGTRASMFHRCAGKIFFGEFFENAGAPGGVDKQIGRDLRGALAVSRNDGQDAAFFGAQADRGCFFERIYAHFTGPPHKPVVHLGAAQA